MSRELRFCLDGDGCLTYAGGAWDATLGLAPPALLGAHWTTLVAAADHAAMEIAIERALSRGGVRPEVEVRMDTGASAQALVHWTLMPGTTGEAIAAVGYEHRAAAEAHDEAACLRGRVEELEALVEDLEDHSRSMEGFAAAAAHQLSEPLIVAESGTIGVEPQPDGNTFYFVLAAA